MSKQGYKERKALGRGLESLFSETQSLGKQDSSVVEKEKKYQELSLERVRPDPLQPRKQFNQESLSELARSISQRGILQPLIVSKVDKNFYQIVAGERRYRAAEIAGLRKVPVLIKESVTDQKSLEWALIENIQREDLNIIEEAEAYNSLIKKHGMTQKQIADVVGKDRSSVANALRILGLSYFSKKQLKSGSLSFGHAKVLLSCGDKTLEEELSRKVVRGGLSVKALQSLVNLRLNQKKNQKTKREENLFLRPLLKTLREWFETGVKIHYRKGRGKIELEFYSNEQFTSLVDKLKNE